MAKSFEELAARVRDRLTPQERDGAIVYLTEQPIAAGSRLELPGVVIVPKAEANIAFVDQDPAANWGHSARYIVIASDSGKEIASVAARLPPFGAGGPLRWRLAYRSPSAPPAVVP